jgi:hypothetical protein
MPISGATILDFLDDFLITESPAGEVNIAIDSGTVQKKSEKGAPGGYASLDASGFVVQYPTAASMGGGIGKIPIGGFSGKLDASWGGTAGSLATLDSTAKVVQNPASATATPTADSIPIADGSGKLDSWVSAVPSSGPYEIYISLGSEPMTV